MIKQITTLQPKRFLADNAVAKKDEKHTIPVIHDERLKRKFGYIGTGNIYTYETEKEKRHIYEKLCKGNPLHYWIKNNG